MNTTFPFPGQGSQKPGMLHHLISHQATEEVLREMSETLGFDLRSLDSQESLKSTVAVQLALLAAGVATARVLIRQGLQPTAVAGLSVGAFAAAVIAEAITLGDATRLVRLRAEQMEKLYPRGYGMAALIGLDEPAVSQLVYKVSKEDNPVFVGNINAPRQIVIVGSITGLKQAVALALRCGARKAELLDVAVPSHCRLMEPVARLLHEKLQGMAVHDPQLVYISNVKARAIRFAEGIASDLADNIAYGVRWHDTTIVAHELGCELFLEMQPGHILSDLVRDNLPGVEAHPVLPDNLKWILTRARQ
jgi:malonate decarboxylase epsilon subunit